MKHGADTGTEHGERRCYDKEWRREPIADQLQWDTVAFMTNLHQAYRRIQREDAVLGSETGTLTHCTAACVTQGRHQHQHEYKQHSVDLHSSPPRRVIAHARSLGFTQACNEMNHPFG